MIVSRGCCWVFRRETATLQLHIRISLSCDARTYMLRRLLPSFVALAALLFMFVQPAAAQQRIALVIGNAAYPRGPLQTSLADGGLVAEALTSIGFEIVEGADRSEEHTSELQSRL